MDPPDNYQTTYDSKTKIGVFYSLIILIILKHFQCSIRIAKKTLCMIDEETTIDTKIDTKIGGFVSNFQGEHSELVEVIMEKEIVRV